VDADRLYALFESGDFFSLDHDGKTIWSRKLTEDFGKFGGDFGQGASPVLTQSGVVVLADHDGESWIASFNKSTGEILWKTDRETALSWASPLVIERAGNEQIICSSGGSVTSYNANDGELLWSYTDVVGNTVPSPSIAGDNIVISGGDRQANLVLQLDETDPSATPSIA
jgi:outer membrane protein assembly factor BamB